MAPAVPLRPTLEQGVNGPQEHERLATALSARTPAELATLTADLPPVSATGGVAGAEAKEVVRIELRRAQTPPS
ncbi:hypothetical protein ACFQVC_23060 [Streptomyces monticola]|uniref:Uncharacterized protein n=1 Tax=Streptomyces monticola TaxID=2666263 RepID=A0ABW2JLV8_9ACTN